MKRALLDTNMIVMILADGDRLSSAHRKLLTDPDVSFLVSAVSLWEMAIKVRSGKLRLPVDPIFYASRMSELRIEVVSLDSKQAVADSNLPEKLKDPFDRIIVAIAEQDDLMFVTTDAKLIDHPLAWRP